MAINSSLRTFIDGMQGKFLFCHQATLSILRHVKDDINHMQAVNDSAKFADQLRKNRENAGIYNAKRAIPPNLYDVFGFFLWNGEIAHSAIVVDISDRITLAECDNFQGEIRYYALAKSLQLRDDLSVRLFQEKILDQILQDLPQATIPLGRKFTLSPG